MAFETSKRGHSQARKPKVHRGAACQSECRVQEPSNGPQGLRVGAASPRVLAAPQRMRTPVSLTYKKLSFAIHFTGQLFCVTSSPFDTCGLPNIKLVAPRTWIVSSTFRNETSLGFMYSIGEGVARDDVKAAEFYRKAAKNVNKPIRLSQCQTSGPNEVVTCIQYFRRACCFPNRSAFFKNIS
jgi:hypothetical protein